jgi:hypothetical protein
LVFPEPIEELSPFFPIGVDIVRPKRCAVTSDLCCRADITLIFVEPTVRVGKQNCVFAPIVSVCWDRTHQLDTVVISGVRWFYS